MLVLYLFIFGTEADQLISQKFHAQGFCSSCHLFSHYTSSFTVSQSMMRSVSVFVHPSFSSHGLIFCVGKNAIEQVCKSVFEKQ